MFIAYPGYTLPPSVLEFQAAGHLANLSSSPWVKRIPAFAKPLISVGGKPYGWMARVFTPSIVYNKDLFQNLGLTVPKTFAQFLNVCRTIKQKAPNLIPLSLAGSQFTSLGGNAVVFASSTVYGKDPNWNAKRQRGQTTFASTPGWHTALQRYVDMKNAGCFGPGVASDTAASTFQQFVPGNSVMFVANDGYFSVVRGLNPKIRIGQFVVPSDTQAGTYMSVFTSDTLVVNAHSHNLPAARAFVDFVARQKQNTLLAKVAGGMAAYDYAAVLNPKIGAKALDEDHARPGAVREEDRDRRLDDVAVDRAAGCDGSGRAGPAHRANDGRRRLEGRRRRLAEIAAGS